MFGYRKLLFKLVCIGFFSLTFFFLSTSKVLADQTWDGGGGVDTNWNNCVNWTTDLCPGLTDIAIFNGTSSNNVTINANIDVKGISIATGYGGIISQSAGVTVAMEASGFNQSTGTFTGNNASIDVNGDFIISGGTFTSTNSILTVSNNFTKSGTPTFNANGGTVTLDGANNSNYTISASGITFNLVTINKTASATLSNYTLTIVSGTTLPLGNTPTVTLNNTGIGGSTYYLTNSGTIIVGTGTTTFNIDGTFSNTGTISGSTNLLAMNATFTNSGTVTLVSCTNFDFNDFNSGAGSLTNSGTATFTTGASPIFTIAGSFIIANTSTFPANPNVSFDGTSLSNSTIDAPTVTFITPVIINRNPNANFYNLVFSISSGTTIPLGDSPTITLNNPGVNATYSFINSGTLSVGTGTLTFNIDGTFSNTGTISGSTNLLAMNATFTNSGTVTLVSCTNFDFNDFNSGAGSLTNSGTATFTTGASPVFTIASSFIIANTSTFPANPNVSFDGTSLSNSTIDAPTVTFVTPVTINRNPNGNFYNQVFSISSGTTIPLGNSPTITLNNSGVNSTYSFINSGNITVGTGVFTMNIDGSFTNSVTTGVITGSNTSWVINGDLVNNGSITMSFCNSFDLNIYTSSSSGSLTNASGATFAMAANPTFTINASFIVSSGSVSFPTTGVTLTLDGTYSGNSSVDASSITFVTPVTINRIFNSVSTNAVLTIASGTTIPLGNAPTITLQNSSTGGYALTNNGTITVGTGVFTANVEGNFTNSVTTGVIIGSNTSWVMNGDLINNGSITMSSLTSFTSGTSGSSSTGGFTNNPGGTFMMTANPSFSIIGNFTINNGSISFPTTGISLTLTGSSGTQTLTTPYITSYAAISKTAASILGLTEGITTGDFTFSAGTIGNPGSLYFLKVSGNFSESSATAFGGANLPITFEGANNQTISKTAGTFTSVMIVNKSGGVLTLSTAFETTGTTCTVTSGIFSLNGKSFTCGSTFTIQSSGTLRIVGLEVVTPVLDAGSTVEYVGDGDGLADIYAPQTWTYSNLKVNFTDSMDSLLDITPNTLVDSSLIDYWPMDEVSGTNVTNSVGSNNLTAYNGASILPGKFGNARNFVIANSQYLNSISNVGITGSASRTVSFWFNPSSSAVNQSLFAWGTGGSGGEFGLKYNQTSNGIYFWASNADTAGHVNTITLNTWNNVIATYNGSSVNVYINGSSTPDISVTRSLNTGNSILHISDSGGWGGYYGGLIDDFRIYNRVLSTSEITTLASGLLTNSISIPSLTINNDFTLASGIFRSPTTLNIGGNFSNTGGTFTNNSGTVVMNATDTGHTLSGTMTGSSSFYNLTFNGSGGAWSFGANSSTITNDLNISNGIVTAPSTTLTVAKNFSNSGTFTNNSGTVVLNGTNQTIIGNTTFFNLSKTVTSPDTLYYEGHVSNTTTVNGTWTMKGTAGNLLSLHSTSTPTMWRVAPSGTRDIAYLSVKDSNNIDITSITVTGLNITNEGNNINWNFNQPAVINSISNITEATDASGYVSYDVSVSDPDLNNTKIKLEYSIDSGTNWFDPYILTAVPTIGSIDLDNTQVYQVGSVNPIDTSTGVVSIHVTWDTRSGLNGGGSLSSFNASTVKIRVTPNDFTLDGTPFDTASFGLDNVSPTGLNSLGTSPVVSGNYINVNLTWASITENHFNHFEIWYGLIQSDVDTRSGTSIKWDQNNDANLSNVVTTTTQIPAFNLSTYYFKVFALDNFGNTSTVNSVSQYINTAPNVPINLGPVSLIDGSWTSDNTPTLSFDLSDPDGGTFKYQIQIDNNSNFLSPEVLYTSILSSTSARTFTSPELADGNYYWRVKTIDPLLIESNWTVANGGSIAFKIDTTASTVPGIPSTLTPTANSTPTWTWTASIDIGGVGLKNPTYLVEWCSDITFVGCNSNTASSNTNSYTHTAGLTSGTWYIRVKSSDILNNESIYSAIGSVIISASAPVGSIVINANDTYTHSNSVTLTITGSDNFDDPSSLQMMLSSTPDFLGSVYEPFNTLANWNFNNTSEVKAIYLKLKNTLGVVSSVFSDNIIYDTVSPVGLSFTSPINTTINISRPEFKWHIATDILSGIDKYKLTVTFVDNTSFSLDNLESFDGGIINSYEHSQYSIWKDGEYIYFKTKDSGLWGAAENNGEIKNGLVSVRIESYDKSGNMSFDTQIFTSDLISPAIVLNSIDNFINLNIQPDSISKSYTLLNTKPLFKGIISSGELSEVKLVATNSNSETRSCTVSTSNSWECMFSNALTIGRWNVNISATDSVGNINSLPTIILNIIQEQLDTVVVDTSIVVTNTPVVETPTNNPPINQPLESGYSLYLTFIDSNNNPIEGARITLPNNDIVYFTDRNGRVTINQVKEGQQKVFIEYNGKTGEQTISATGNDHDIRKVIELKLNSNDTILIIAIIIGLLLFLILITIFVRKIYLKVKKNSNYN